MDIVSSQREYWEYLYSGSKWNGSKDGLLQIILDIYEEINKRHWLDFEFTDRAPSNEEDTLSDLLLIVALF